MPLDNAFFGKCVRVALQQEDCTAYRAMRQYRGWHRRFWRKGLCHSIWLFRKIVGVAQQQEELKTPSPIGPKPVGLSSALIPPADLLTADERREAIVSRPTCQGRKNGKGGKRKNKQGKRG